MGVNYSNSLSYPIMVSVTGTSASAAAYIYVDGLQVGAQYVGGTVGLYATATAIVPPGSIYSATGGGIVYWMELY